MANSTPTAPPGRRMGHAGAIVSGGKGTAAAKQAAMEDAGIEIAVTPSDMADALHGDVPAIEIIRAERAQRCQR